MKKWKLSEYSFMSLRMMSCKSYPEGFLKIPPSLHHEKAERQTKDVATTAHVLIPSDPSDLSLSKTLHTTPFLLQSDRAGFNVLCLSSENSRIGIRENLVLKKERGDLLVLEGKCC